MITNKYILYSNDINKKYFLSLSLSLSISPLQANAAASSSEGAVISVDVGRKIAIWTAPGQPEKRAAVEKGPRGFCTADFGWGPLDTEMPNLLYDVRPDAPNNLRRRPAAASKKKSKKPKFAHSSKQEDVEDEEENEDEENDNGGVEEAKDTTIEEKKKQDSRKNACPRLVGG